MTNQERLKNMTQLELAEELSHRFVCYTCPSPDCPGNQQGCRDYLFEWLGEEAEQ